MENIGHNQPPNMAVVAEETAKAISDWMKDHPVIETEEDARQAKLHLDRGTLCRGDLEAERDRQVRPLNERVDAINESYRAPKSLLAAVVNEIGVRLTAFMKAEKAKREAAAQEAAMLAAEAEQEAREAERREQEGLAGAAVGELDVDVLALKKDADDAFKRFEKAGRTAARAERETNVKIGGGFRRAIGLRSSETLNVTDVMAAVAAIGPSDAIKEAVIKSARAYRKLRGELPPGVVATVEGKI